MAVINRIAQYYDEMKGWRRHLHQHPELDLECYDTAAFVSEKLRSFGVDEIHEGIAQSGIVALIKGRKEGPVIGLRADMDALPMQEARDIEHKSKIDGAMHACGHDGHTTMLLGAAKYLTETRNFAGTVALIFQPGEEDSGGGRIMVEEGIIDTFDIKEVYALHSLPQTPVGFFSTCTGPIMASVDDFTFQIYGKGGHAAHANDTVDPLMAAVQIYQTLQSVVTRNIDPLKPVVLSITQIHGGSASNVIPASAMINGTVRTMDEDVRYLMKDRIYAIVQGVAESLGCSVTIDYKMGYPVTVNHSDQTNFAVQIATEISGETMVEAHDEPTMGAEDFAYMLNERPGCYLYVGNGDTAGLHHPDYDFDDETSPYGASFFARVAEARLPL